MHSDFDHITTWVFDLDETLYPLGAPLFPQIEARMTRWIMEFLNVDAAKAARLRAQYWHDHGTTLAGLMREHDMDPHPFLVDVHDIDFTVLAPAPDLHAAISALPGRRIIYTNGTVPYAHQVLAARGLSGLWDAVYGVEDAELHPKPDRAAFDIVFAKDGLDRGRAAMFEDSHRNLLVPHDMGLTTVQVATPRDPGAHIHHHTTDLAAFLRDIASTGEGATRALPI